LTRTEVVHHIDHDPSNNKIENLVLFANNGEHKRHEGFRVVGISGRKKKLLDISSRFGSLEIEELARRITELPFAKYVLHSY